MRSKKTSWNHNYAYNRWVSKKVGKRISILDVGCGDGTLAQYLRADDNNILGIDISDSAIQKANKKIHAAMFRSFKQLLKIFRQTTENSMQSFLWHLFIIWIW